jgi:hypothetical protein
MAKNKISEWSATAANNTDIGGIDIAEGCAPSGINNAIRELMAQVKDQQTGTDADNFTVGGNLYVTGTTTATGAITANGGVTGNLTGNVTGNLTGNVTGNVSGTSLNVTGTVAVANGGTGVTSSTGTGSVVLSNSPTLVTPNLGTPSTLVATNASGTANNLNAGFGVNQTWQNVLSSRTAGTSYQNTTGKTIEVAISGDGGGSSKLLQVSTDNSTWIATGILQSTNDVNAYASVPNDNYYRVESGASLVLWSELR